MVLSLQNQKQNKQKNKLRSSGTASSPLPITFLKRGFIYRPLTVEYALADSLFHCDSSSRCPARWALEQSHGHRGEEARDRDCKSTAHPFLVSHAKQGMSHRGHWQDSLVVPSVECWHVSFCPHSSGHIEPCAGCHQILRPKMVGVGLNTKVQLVFEVGSSCRPGW